METSSLRSYLTLGIVLAFIIVSTLVYEIPEVTDAVSGSTANWQRGASIDPASVNDFSSEEFRQSLSDLAATGANHVTFVINVYQETIHSNEMHVGDEVPSDEVLMESMRYANSLGLSTGIKFHMETYDSQWRAFIDPQDKDRWFSNYSNIVLHYAQIAHEEGVQEITIGAELINTASEAVDPHNTQLWQGLISELRGFYAGNLTYSANWGGSELFNEKDHIGFWSELDYIGIAPYYPLPRDPDRPVESMMENWHTINTREIEPLHQTYGKPIKFTEVGYRSVNDANTDPYAAGRSGTYDPQIQVELYEALFAYWSEQTFFVGVDIWDWEGSPHAGGEGNTDYTPQNKPALGVMTTWFGGNGTAPEPEPDPDPDPEPRPDPDPEQPISFEVSGSNSTENPRPGQEMETTVEIMANQDLENIIINMEVYNSAGEIAIQYYYWDNFSKNQTKVYTFTWAPSEEDDMNLHVGLFSPHWQELLHWEHNLHEFIVRYDNNQEQADRQRGGWWRENRWWDSHSGWRNSSPWNSFAR